VLLVDELRGFGADVLHLGHIEVFRVAQGAGAEYAHRGQNSERAPRSPR